MDSECEDPASASERALRRHSSEVGAVCSNPARTDLCGGRRETGVPTATKDTGRRLFTLTEELFAGIFVGVYARIADLLASEHTSPRAYAEGTTARFLI